MWPPSLFHVRRDSVPSPIWPPGLMHPSRSIVPIVECGATRRDGFITVGRSPVCPWARTAVSPSLARSTRCSRGRNSWEGFKPS